jgi:hypothetical protein
LALVAQTTGEIIETCQHNQHLGLDSNGALLYYKQEALPHKQILLVNMSTIIFGAKENKIKVDQRILLNAKLQNCNSSLHVNEMVKMNETSGT